MALESVEIAPGQWRKMTPEDAKAFRARAKQAKPADKSAPPANKAEGEPKLMTSERAKPKGSTTK